MERQIYYNQKEGIEAFISDRSSMVISTIHPVSKHQIISIPETRLYRGSEKNEAEMREEIRLQINRKNSEKITNDIMENTKAYIYSALP